MLADKKLVSTLIPQDYPMIMVDELISNNNLETSSSFLILEDNIFCSDGLFREPGLIENIAQTAALRAGYQAFVNNEQPLIGYIGSVKKLRIFGLPNINERLLTSVKIVSELMNAIIIEGEIKVGDSIVARGNLNIFLQ